MRSFLRLWHRWWLAWSSCEWIWGNKKAEASDVLLLSVLLSAMFYLPWCSLETVSDLRPFLRRALSTRRPLAVCIRRRNPCLLILFLLWGWNVLFIFRLLCLFVLYSFISVLMTWVALFCCLFRRLMQSFRLLASPYCLNWALGIFYCLFWLRHTCVLCLGHCHFV